MASTSTSITTYKTDEGKLDLAVRNLDLTDHALLRPIVDHLIEAITLIGIEPPQLTDAGVLLGRATAAFREAVEARPELEDDQRREAIKIVRAAIQELKAAQKMLGSGPRNHPMNNPFRD